MDERTEQHIRARILTMLTEFGRLSITHLGQGIRPYNQAWRDVLQRLLAEGLVIHEQNVVERAGSKRIAHTYQLAHNA